MVSMFLIVAIVGLSFTEVIGRAVNISGTWFLPQEGFPMFYRYFNDKLTWNEAEAVCGYHHADLLSVQTNTQMDAARAYLKEIDVTDNVWIGLRRESPEKAFFWMNGEKLLDDGYWVEPTPKTNEKLCAAIDPVSDFRWNSFYCRGPQIASFVCELPVPEWAKKEDGCMITSLPSLTVTLMPETGVVQLFSDCGLDGTRRIACKGGVNREELIKRLSCDVDVFASTIFGKSTTEAVKDVNMQLNTFQSGGEELNRYDTTQTFKTWHTYAPLTRHRRNGNVSPPETPVSLGHQGTQSPQEMKTEEVTSTQVIPKQTKSEVLNFPSHLFPHSPYLAAERNAPSTKVSPPSTTPKTIEKTQISKESKETTLTVTPHEVSTTTNPTTKNITSGTVTKTSNNTKEVTTHEPPKVNSTPVTVDYISKEKIKDIPVLIITDEKVNDALSLNSSIPTSENPEIVVMIENEELSEPYVVPLGDDIAVNNPSLSPVEIMVEVEKLTTPQPTDKTDKTTSSIEEIPVQKAETTHPLKMGEKIMSENQNHTKTSKMIRSLNVTPSTSKVTASSITGVEQITEKLNTTDDDKKVDSVEVPQKPNRGRLLTRSNHLSFYPYFLNRVLG